MPSQANNIGYVPPILQRFLTESFGGSAVWPVPSLDERFEFLTVLIYDSPGFGGPASLIGRADLDQTINVKRVDATPYSNQTKLCEDIFLRYPVVRCCELDDKCIVSIKYGPGKLAKYRVRSVGDDQFLLVDVILFR